MLETIAFVGGDDVGIATCIIAAGEVGPDGAGWHLTARDRAGLPAGLRMLAPRQRTVDRRNVDDHRKQPSRR